MSFTTRRVFKTSSAAPGVIRGLLQNIFLCELLVPGQEVSLVSPWISDVEIIDNQSGGFTAINPDWRSRGIRLTEIGAQLMSVGCRIKLVTRSDEHNQAFVAKLKEVAEELGLVESLEIVIRDELHIKGIVTSHGVLLGSMNITYSGLEINDEFIEYETDPSVIASARLNLNSYFEMGQ